MSILHASSLGLVARALAGLFTKRITFATYNGLLSIAQALAGIQAIRQDAWGLAIWHAALCALFTWFWWHHGGGDGTRRRLRRLARRFQPVRRTAPQAA
ncbi:hypothetical protein E1265_36425 [Streptomyces sp. 8K308]|uniref:hypothetical protein n=1 Tax=Streptomyces sp. 8K308 TaxID=2530388 RepID=UPI00104EBA56|nr:hypothetical protein [Streptomyces sp. 8K308]TDC03570.1 hypothetical protein E1265_36425 [Streptomyces sp. 8K308]